MKYIFFGTPEFAAIILEQLIEAGMIPAAVVTNPDRPAGRKKFLTMSAVKGFMIHDLRFKNTLVIMPEKLDEDIVIQLKKIGADIGILAAYGKIVPQEIIDMFPRGIIVVHPSLLPRYRGATPIQTAILNGDTETGTTLFLMDEKVDHGPIVAFSIERLGLNETYETLMKKLAEVSADLLIETLPRYLRGEIIPQAQDEMWASYTKKLTSDDGFINLKKDAPERVWRMVRALNPEPGAWALARGRRLKILAAEFHNGILVLKRIQWEGKRPKDVQIPLSYFVG